MFCSYSVLLIGAQGTTAVMRISAETRYAAVLEAVLGGPEQVAAAYAAWLASNAESAEHSDKKLVEQSVHWYRAAIHARQAALQAIGDPPGADFEVRLVPGN